MKLAHRYVTINVPDLGREPSKVLNLVKTKSRPISTILLGMFLGQALIGSAVTYFEAQSVIKVNTKLQLLEEELERNY